MQNDSYSEFSIADMGLARVLKQHRLTIPAYQREYSWKSEEVRELFADLNKAKTDSENYFLGTIVAIPEAGAPDSLAIVDGQQRLATTTLLITAIRNYLLTTGEGELVIEAVEKDFLSAIDLKREERVARLSLNVDDRPFFSALIGRDHTSEPTATRQSHRLLSGAKLIADDFIKNVASQYDERSVVEVLKGWIEYLDQRAKVILLAAPSNAQAFRMFETLNDRGRQTTQADLVKSYLIGEARDREVEAVARWSSMMTTIEEVDDDDRVINFLRHTLIATRAFTRAGEIYSTVQKSARGVTEALQFLSDLDRLASVYVATFNPDARYWTGYPERARRALRTLKLLNIKPFRPLLLSIGERFSEVEGDKSFRLLVSVGVRSLITGKIHAGQMDEICSRAALSIYRRQVSSAAELTKALSSISISDAEFSDRFEGATVTKVALARYYLHSLEMTGADAEPELLPNEDPQSVTLEHILPKKPHPGEWLNFSEDEVRSFSKRLGNMCLLTKAANSSSGSDEFNEKRLAYQSSSFRLTSSLAKFDDWSREAIAARQKELANLAKKTWAI